MEEDDETSVQEAIRNCPSIPDTQDTKHPAGHAYLNCIHFWSLAQAQILFKLNSSVEKGANYMSATAAIPDWRYNKNRTRIWCRGEQNQLGDDRLSNYLYRFIISELPSWRKQLSVQSTDNSSVSTRLAEHRGLPADFPLVTQCVNALAVRPRWPCCLCSSLCRYPSYDARCRGGTTSQFIQTLSLGFSKLCISKTFQSSGPLLF